MNIGQLIDSYGYWALAGSWLQQASGTIDWILGGVAVVAIVTVLLVVRHAARRGIASRARRYS